MICQIQGVSHVKNYWILIVLIISTIKGNVLYVSTTGNDESGDGSASNPYLTIQEGLKHLLMFIVLVLNGIWQGGVTIDNKQITLMGESMDDTKLNITLQNLTYLSQIVLTPLGRKS